MSSLTQLKLTPRQERAARLLADGWRQSDVARELGFVKQTLTRWLKRPLFKRRIEELRVDSTRQVEDLLTLAAPEAAQLVVDIAAGRGKLEDSRLVQAQLKAALYVLDRVLRPRRAEAAPVATVADPTAGFTEDEVEALLETAELKRQEK